MAHGSARGGAVGVVLCSLLLLLPALGRAAQVQAKVADLSQLPLALSSQVQSSRLVSSGAELLQALNASAGSSVNEAIQLQGRRSKKCRLPPQPLRPALHLPRRRLPLPPPAACCRFDQRCSCCRHRRLPSSPAPRHACLPPAGDITITPSDLLPFKPSLPINSGNRTLILAGAPRLPGGVSGNLTTLDWGGAVNVMYHPAQLQFFIFGLQVQGVPPDAAGFAAGLPSQVVSRTLWPTYSGEPGHLVSGWGKAQGGTARLMSAVSHAGRFPTPIRAAERTFRSPPRLLTSAQVAFWNSTLQYTSNFCTQESFAAKSLEDASGLSNGTILAWNFSIYASQMLNGSYAVRKTCHYQCQL